MTPLLVALGAAVGAPVRYVADRAIQQSGRDFPLGTLVVNAAGSLILGFLAGAGVAPATMALLGAGFCGGLTTYSTFGYETGRLVEERAYLVAIGNVLGNVAIGIGAAALGYIGGGALA